MFQVDYFLTRNATCHPDRLAIASAKGSLTWKELDEQATWLAQALRAKGVLKGMRVAVLWHNSVEWALIWYACQRVGAVPMPLNTRLLPREIVRHVELAACEVMFCAARFAATAQSVAAASELQLLVVEDSPLDGAVSWDELLACGSSERLVPDVREDDEAVVLFTSGTTGEPKGVVRTQRMVRDHALVLAMGDGGTQAEVMVTASPLYHTAGLLCVLKMAALSGTLVLAERLDPPVVLDLIERYRATQVMLVPPVVYGRLAGYGRWRSYDLSSVRQALISAGRCDLGYARIAFMLFPNANLRFSWGSTEACSITGASVSREEIEHDPELVCTVGTVNSLVEVRLVDEAGKDVPEGAVGEALVRSPLVFGGYLGEGERDDVFVDGWLKTGDMLKRDAQGFYYLVDRKKDVIKTGGENVYALEVERVLLTSPAIEDCAVVGVRDERYEEGIAVALKLAPGASITADEVLAVCEGRLPGFKKPRYWAIVDELPTNSVGKVQKGTLRARGRSLFSPLRG